MSFKKIKYKIHKDFLEKTFFNQFQKFIFSYGIAWFWEAHQHNSKDRGFFRHSFYLQHEPRSPHYVPFIVPILQKLKCKMVSNIRANCLVKDHKPYTSTFHCDRSYNCKTAILYMNTNNGYTLLGEKEKIKIDSEANQMVVFNSQTKHCAVSQTDQERRIVINFNYV
tara:strand:+ start:89 stop:589 length:501 start_codon:yes stop_codon:yes gene_type:complete